MTERVSPEHPRCVLLFAFEDDPSDDQCAAMEILAERLEDLRPWTVGPPEFVDMIDEAGCTDPGDEPVRTVGVYIELYSGLPPWGERIPLTVDRAQYDEAHDLVFAMAEFARTHRVELVVGYDEESIGDIDANGTPDRGILTVFLEEWRRSLDARGSR